MAVTIHERVMQYKRAGRALPAFNIPHLPMVEAVSRAVADEGAYAMVQVARIEWTKFHAESLEAVAKAFYDHADTERLYLHLDHIPVVDEDDNRVDYLDLIQRGIDAGYASVMVDASRLPLDENIDATAKVTAVAHRAGIPVEGEIGAVFGHEERPPENYEALFASKRGFTVPREAARYADESACDWLSVSFGSIHGFVADHLRDKDKPAARLDIDHLREIEGLVRRPLVLHGGSGIPTDVILEAVRNGIAKINIGNAIRLAYERGGGNRGEIAAGQEACYHTVRELVRQFDPATAEEGRV